MSVLIKDMEKPKSCYAVIDGEPKYCPFVNTDDDCVLQLEKGICEGTWADQYSKCPLIEAPEPCEDTVSREAVSEWLKQYGQDVLHGKYKFSLMYIWKNLMDLPSAQPEQRWITERMPEDTVLVTVETKTFKNRYVCEAVWIPRWSWKAEFDNWEDCSEYNEDDDEYYVLEGWYERVHNWDEYSFVGIEGRVIAWMPLPEGYKGE